MLTANCAAGCEATGAAEPLLPTTTAFFEAVDLACETLSGERPIVLGLLIDFVLLAERETFDVEDGCTSDTARSVVTALVDLGVEVWPHVPAAAWHWRPVAIVASRLVEVAGNPSTLRLRVKPIACFHDAGSSDSNGPQTSHD